MFSGIFIVVNLGVSFKGAAVTWMTSLFFLVSALMNVGLNIMLIPVYGTMGAALATLVAYIALAVMAYLFTQRIYPVPFEIGRFLVALGIGIVLYFVDYRAAQGQSIVLIWGIHIGTLLLYGLCLSFLGGLPYIMRRMPSFIHIEHNTKRS
jgi:O-antigen/teichoic acid export membrane protein